MPTSLDVGIFYFRQPDRQVFTQSAWAASCEPYALGASAGHPADRLHFLTLGLSHLEEAELIFGNTASQAARFSLEVSNSIECD